jgi:hypothetical protein
MKLYAYSGRLSAISFQLAGRRCGVRIGWSCLDGWGVGD